jgi:DNA-binding protein H-NS
LAAYRPEAVVNRDIFRLLSPRTDNNNEASEMRNGQLDKMPLKELLSLEVKITSAIAEKRVSERVEMRTALEEMARKSGFTLGELFGRKGKGSKVAPKYRNPKDADQTWTGRGRRPNWLVEAGGDMRRFLIAA